ncbi:MAG: hypothetical protein ACOZNI_10435 [Myxococcota bacterium]
MANTRPSELSRRWFLTTAQISRLRSQIYVREGEDPGEAPPTAPDAARPRRARPPVAADLPTLEPLKRKAAAPPEDPALVARREAEARWPGLLDLLPQLHDGALALLYEINASRVAWLRLTLGVPRPPRQPPHPKVWEALPRLIGRHPDRVLAEAFQVSEADVRRAREALAAKG